MKSIIEATISHYHCKECGEKISERDVSIVDSGSRGVNMEIHCSHCHDTANIKAEINVINSPLDLERISQAGAEISRMIELGKTAVGPLSAKLIQDEDILQLRNRLKQTASVEDLFN
jgi:recombinational DNA repair protein RecR